MGFADFVIKRFEGRITDMLTDTVKTFLIKSLKDLKVKAASTSSPLDDIIVNAIIASLDIGPEDLE